MLTVDEVLKVTNDALRQRPQIEAMTSYADALTAAIRRAGAFVIDGMRFERRTDINIPTDYLTTGRHTMVFELAGTGKQYRVMIEPVKETHGGKS